MESKLQISLKLTNIKNMLLAVMVIVKTITHRHDTLMYEIKNEDIYNDFSNIRKCLSLVIIQLSQNIVIIQTN